MMLTLPCNTVTIGRHLRTLYGFSADSAKLALDRLNSITPQRMQGILDEMPTDWLPTDTRKEIVLWWSTPERISRVGLIQKGLADGTLL